MSTRQQHDGYEEGQAWAADQPVEVVQERIANGPPKDEFKISEDYETGYLAGCRADLAGR